MRISESRQKREIEKQSKIPRDRGTREGFDSDRKRERERDRQNRTEHRLLDRQKESVKKILEGSSDKWPRRTDNRNAREPGSGI